MSIGWRPVSTRITSANATAPHQCVGPDQICQPAAPVLMLCRSVLWTGIAATRIASTSSASPKTAIIRSRAAPISAKPLLVSHAAAAIANRASARIPTSTSASWPTPKTEPTPGDRDDQQRDDQARRDERRREPVDDPGPLGVDGALGPQPFAASGRAEAATGRGGPAAAPSATGSCRRAAARAQSRGSGRDLRARFIYRPPSRARASRPSTSAEQIRRVRADVPGLQPGGRPRRRAVPRGSSARRGACRRARGHGRSR